MQIDSLSLAAAVLLLLALDVGLRTFVAVRGLNRLGADLRARADGLDAGADRLPAAAAELRRRIFEAGTAALGAYLSLARLDGRLVAASGQMVQLRERSEKARSSLVGATDLVGRLRTGWQLVRTALAVRRAVGR